MSKKNKELLKKVAVASALVGVLGVTGGEMLSSPIIVEASVEEAQLNVDDMIREVEEYVQLNSDGTISLSSETPEYLREKYNLDALEIYFSELNEQVREGQISVNEDLSINQDIKMARSNVDFVDSYWWGKAFIYSYKNAIREISLFRSSAGYVGAGSAAVGGVIGGPVGALIGGLGGIVGGAYLNGIANSMETSNNLSNGRGVELHINRAGVYSTYSR